MIDRYEDRLFGVLLHAEGWLSFRELITTARMSPALAIHALRQMVERGEVEKIRKFRGKGNGSGAPKSTYRVARRTHTEVAA